MALSKLALQPGVNTLATKTLAEGTWSESNCIRFRQGYLEKMLGWARISQDQVAMPAGGVARSLHGLTGLDGINYLAVGSNTNLELISQGDLYDITPLSSTENVAVNFSTVSGSEIVTIVDNAHGLEENREINLVAPVSVGGLILQGPYIIQTVIDVNTYTIAASSPATSTVNNGGALPQFTTALSDATVTVVFANHGLSTNDLFTIEIATTVGGLNLVGVVLVDTIIDANSFSFEWVTTALSADSAFENNGNVRIEVYLKAGPASTTTLQGYGAGPFGVGTWGFGQPSGQFVDPLRYWFLENIGQTLVAAVSYGTLYEWNPPVSNRATEVINAPDIMTSMFVSMPATQVIALGAEVLGVQDPLLVRFSDAGNINSWIATATNQAGSYRLSHGKRIVGGIQGPMSGLIWTDDSLWQMQYIQPPFVYTFTIVSTGCGLIAPLAMGVLNRNVYWMGVRGFYMYGTGAPVSIPCPVWDNVFQDLDESNMDKCICGVDPTNDEIYWFYPSLSGGTGEIDSYVRMNTNGQWDFGPAGTLLARTAWGSTEGALPPSVDLNSYVQEQETGFNSDTVPMTGVRAMSAYLDIDDGQEMSKIDQIIPDFKFEGTDPKVTLTFYAVDHPADTDNPRIYGPYEVTPQTKYFSILPALRGRQVAVEITSDGDDMWWRLGAIRFRMSPSGRRPQGGG